MIYLIFSGIVCFGSLAIVYLKVKDLERRWVREIRCYKVVAKEGRRIAIDALVKVTAMEKSTHRIEYVPVEAPFSDTKSEEEEQPDGIPSARELQLIQQLNKRFMADF